MLNEFGGVDLGVDSVGVDLVGVDLEGRYRVDCVCVCVCVCVSTQSSSNCHMDNYIRSSMNILCDVTLNP